MKRMLKQLMGALCVLLLASQAWAGGGAYSSTTVGPNVYSKNYIYTSTFYPVGSFPPGSVIGGPTNPLIWSYSTSYRPAGFEAYLCWDSTLSECLNITNMQSGSTSAFNGRPANHSFVLVHRVVGTGTLSPPVYGNMDQIIVNYTYP